MSTPHPCVVTLDHRSKPRVLFSGDKLVEVDLPAGTRVIYPKPPMQGLADPDAAIRYALSQPIASLVVGLQSMRDLEQNAATARNFTPMSDAARERARAEPARAAIQSQLLHPPSIASSTKASRVPEVGGGPSTSISTRGRAGSMSLHVR